MKSFSIIQKDTKNDDRRVVPDLPGCFSTDHSIEDTTPPMLEKRSNISGKGLFT